MKVAVAAAGSANFLEFKDSADSLTQAYKTHHPSRGTQTVAPYAGIRWTMCAVNVIKGRLSTDI